MSRYLDDPTSKRAIKSMDRRIPEDWYLEISRKMKASGDPTLFAFRVVSWLIRDLLVLGLSENSDLWSKLDEYIYAISKIRIRASFGYAEKVKENMAISEKELAELNFDADQSEAMVTLAAALAQSLDRWDHND